MLSITSTCFACWPTTRGKASRRLVRMTWEMAAACVRSCDLAAAENTVYKSVLAKTSYIANCFYSAARVRRLHRQGRAGCYPVMLMGTTSQQDVAPCTVTVGCFRRLASCYLHVRTVVVVVFTFCLSASCSCDHHVFSQPVCLFACFFFCYFWPASCYLHVCVVDFHSVSVF